jgi:hypothetical protein
MRTLHEGARGCGFRKPGGLYMVTDQEGEACGALPVALERCEHCGGGIKPTRGYTWIDPDALLEPHEHGHAGCPMSAPGLLGERAGLLWIGEAFYATPAEWLREAQVMGVSRRISAVPNDFKIGETWVVAAHRKCIPDGWVDTATDQRWEQGDMPEGLGTTKTIEPAFKQGAFHIFRPQRIEYVVKGDETEDELAAFEKRGVEPVKVVPLEQQLLEGGEAA